MDEDIYTINAQITQEEPVYMDEDRQSASELCESIVPIGNSTHISMLRIYRRYMQKILMMNDRLSRDYLKGVIVSNGYNIKQILDSSPTAMEWVVSS